MMKKHQKGFTLVELMIVVAIIAVLAAVALPSFGQQIKKSKDGKAVQMMGSMRSQLGMMIADMEGSNPKIDANIVNMFNDAGGTVTASDDTTATSKGIQGFGKIGTFTEKGTGTLKAGTPLTVNTAYDAAKGIVKFSDGNDVKDTKDKIWNEY